MAHDPINSRRAWRLGLLVEAAMFLASGSAFAQDTLTPPPGSALYLSTTGVGTQNYICSPATNPGETAFRFTGPQSALSTPFVGKLTIEVADNILAAVPVPASTPSPGCVEATNGIQQYCPTWRSPIDQSAVYGTTVASVVAGSSPSCPTSGAVSCLLLKSIIATNGQVSPGLLGAVTYIQRLDTVGGSAPAGECTVGQIIQVPYRATYNFYVQGR